MSRLLSQILRSGPPPPRVVLLPDAMFFTRAIPVVAGSGAADVSAQVELALETLSPFPPAQLYHGFFWPLGAERALVFAAYRRRFTTEQLTEWESAELVIPAFAALLGVRVDPGTTILVPSADCLTALFWNHGPVPERVVSLPIAADATEAERAAVREQLVSQMPGHRVVTLTEPPGVNAGHNEREFAFRAGELESPLSATAAGLLDVRDKEALAALRSARRRDLMLWRGFIGLLVLLLLLFIGEFALVGARFWLQRRQAQADRQRPVVEQIMTAQNLTTRINELSTKRLLPFEMIAIVSARKPETVTFRRVSTSGLYTLVVEAESSTPAAVSAFQAALKADPAVAANPEARDQRARDNQMTFTLVVTFRPEAVRPAGSTP